MGAARPGQTLNQASFINWLEGDAEVVRLDRGVRGAKLPPLAGALFTYLVNNADDIDQHQYATEFRLDLTYDLALMLAERLPDGRSGIKQRNPIKNQVARITNDIVEGRAVFSGQSLIISPDGWLVDGQHRVLALLAAFAPGRPSPVLPAVRIVWARTLDPVRVVDTQAGRSVPHMGQMFHSDWEWHSRQAAGILCEYFEGGTSRRAVMSKQVQMQICAELDVAEEFARVPYSGLRAGELAGSIRALRALKHHGDPADLAVDFWGALSERRQDVNGTPSSALYVYLRWRGRDTTKSSDAREDMARTIACWNAHRLGAKLTKLPPYAKGDDIPEAL